MILTQQQLNIKNNPKKLFFTSDCHFFHQNIIKYCPFRSKYNNIEEMNNSLVQIWNSKINEDDTVFILGDLVFGNSTYRINFLDQLNGKKFLIPGNHDYDALKKQRFRSLFVDILPQLITLDLNPYLLILCHFPIASWHFKERGSIHLHGHSHNTIPWDGRRDTLKRIDVGVDCRESLEPWSLFELLMIIEERSKLVNQRELELEKKYDL